MTILISGPPRWAIAALCLLVGLAVEGGPSATGQETAAPAVVDDPKPAAPTGRQLPRRKGEISFDDLKFDLEKGAPFERSLLPESIEKLHEQNVRLRGFILPTSVYQQEGIKQFVLVRDNQECCFGPGAALYDCVMVYMDEDAAASFSTRPVTVRGKFSVEELKYPDGEGHLAIYRIDASEVK
jgi:hypothetical protein